MGSSYSKIRMGVPPPINLGNKPGNDVTSNLPSPAHTRYTTDECSAIHLLIGTKWIRCLPSTTAFPETFMTSEIMC